MSGLDPLAALAAQAIASADAAISAATLELGVPAHVLKMRVEIGDVLEAKVLPPQNGSDYIEIAGARVTADLPGAVRPGETLALQVQSITGTQIVVRNLGVVPHAPQTAAPEAAAPHTAPPREAAVAAVLRQAAAPVARALPQVEARIAATQALKVPAAAPRVSAVASNAAAVVQHAVRTTSDLLKILQLPDTGFVRTVIAIAQNAPARLLSVLQRLEAALPQHFTDPRIATLKTIAPFALRIDPSNAQTLPAQLSAYVSHVVEGAEPKLVQLLQAHAESSSTAQSGSGSAPAHPSSAQVNTAPAPQNPPAHPVLQAHAAERAAAAQHDLKFLVLSLLRTPPEERSPALTQALNETLITLTGTQVNVLAANAQDPGTIVLPVPVYFYEGGKPAQLRVSRDPDAKGKRLDADDFHVTFVLDTAHLGTVAIDLQSAGRSVKIDVKTQRESAASRFTDTLGSLRQRLEHLRYRVTSASASANVQASKPRARAAPSAAGLDLQA